MESRRGDACEPDHRSGACHTRGGGSLHTVLLRRAGHAVHDESGTAVFLTLLIMAFLFVIGLIAVNAAVMFGARVSTQRAADAATLAGCFDLPNAGKASASAVRFGSSGGGLNATTASNLESGRGNQSAAPVIDSTGTLSARTGEVLENDRITVDIDRTQGLIGAPSSGFVDQGIGAYAECTREEGSIAVLTALGGGSGALTIEDSTVDVGDNGIIACSTNPGALVIAGSTVTARYIDTGSGEGVNAGSSVDPWPPTERDDCRETHPFASVTPPSTPGGSTQECPSLPLPLPGLRPCTVLSSTTLDSGVYPGGVQLGVNFLLCNFIPIPFVCGDIVVRLNCVSDPCVFYMQGGGFEVNQRVTVIGNGAVIHNGPGESGACGAVQIRDGTELQMTPAGGGAYEGLIVYQSPACSTPMTVNRGTSIGGESATPAGIYLPAGDLNVVEPIGVFGPGATTLNTIIVASRIQIGSLPPAGWPRDFVPSGTVHHGDYGLTE